MFYIIRPNFLWIAPFFVIVPKEVHIQKLNWRSSEDDIWDQVSSQQIDFTVTKALHSMVAWNVQSIILYWMTDLPINFL